MKLRSLASREHRPLIGVTTSEVRPKERVNPVPEGEPLGKEMALGTTYLKAIEEAGGLRGRRDGFVPASARLLFCADRLARRAVKYI